MSEVQFVGTVAPEPITGVIATATTEEGFRNASYLVDGSGLTGNQHATFPNGSMWFSGATTPQAVIFDLGAVYDVSQLKVWNYNEGGDFPNPGDTLVNLGAKDVSVTYGTTLSGFTLSGVTGTIGSITSFTKASGLSNYTGETFSAPFQARYVKFNLTSIYGHPLNKVGLSEVQFVGTAAPGPNASYGSWASLNAGNGNPDEDFDKDGMSNGVEFFMGQTGSSFTPNPPLVGGKVSWAKNPAALASYVVQTSSNLRDELVSGDGGWAPVASGVVDNGTSVEYTVPAGDPKRFTRLKVTVTP